MTTSNRETCPRCNMPRYNKSSGSMTEWIASCRCDVVAPVESQKSTINLCNICGKRINRGRAGSFTQFIFRFDLCSCDKPVLKPTFSGSSAPSPSTSFKEEEVIERDPDLAVNSEAFPSERYEPLKKVGMGAAGEVFVCFDKRLKKHVAVKILRNSSADQLVAFQNEARVLSKLDHPNIVRILDFDATASGVPYMVLEHSPGSSLKAEMNKHGKISEPSARLVFLRLIDALMYCHDHNILHRDLKPENIIFAVKPEGPPIVKLIDFGIALVADQEQTTVDGRIIVGTPAYMSPDQVSGHKYDVRSEIYSFGCMLFEALTGRVPFLGETSLEILSKHAKETPPLLRAFAPESSAAMEKVVATCLAKAPDDRFQNVRDLGRALYLTQEMKEGSIISDLDQTWSEGAVKSGAQAENRKLYRIMVPVAIMLIIGICVPFLFSKTPEHATTASIKKKNSFVEPKYTIEKRSEGENVWTISGEVTREALRDLARNYNPNGVQVSRSNTEADWNGLEELRKCDSLTELRVNDCKFTDKDCKKLLLLPELEYLNVSATNISDNGIKTISELKKLVNLQLGHCHITGKSIEYLQGMPHIKTLNLTEMNHVTLAQLRLLKTMPKLEEIDLSENPIGDEGLKVLSTLNASALSLEDIGASNKGLAYLASKKIQSLNISDNSNCNDECIPALLKLPNLRHLYVGNRCKITQKGAAILKAKRPDLTVAFLSNLTDPSAKHMDAIESSAEDLKMLDPHFFDGPQ